jgi:hypothetical protein
VYSLAEKNITVKIPKGGKPEDYPQTFGITQPAALKQKEIDEQQNRVVSVQQGRYEITARQFSTHGEDSRSVTETTIPFTDEGGYQVIGAFPYGRNVNPLCVGSLKRSSDLPLSGSAEAQALTLATPVYQRESDTMDNLFNQYDPTEEGALSRPLSSILSEGYTEETPEVLGKQKTTILEVIKASGPTATNVISTDFATPVTNEEAANRTVYMTPVESTSTPSSNTTTGLRK